MPLNSITMFAGSHQPSRAHCLFGTTSPWAVGVTGRACAWSCSAWDFLIPCVVRNTTARTQHPRTEHGVPQMAYLLLPQQNAGSSLRPHKSLRHQSPRDKAKQALFNCFFYFLHILMNNISFVLFEALAEIYSVGQRRWSQDVATENSGRVAGTALTSMQSPSHLLLPISLAQESLNKTFTSWCGCVDLLTSHELCLASCLKLGFYRRHLYGD